MILGRSNYFLDSEFALDPHTQATIALLLCLVLQNFIMLFVSRQVC